mgnify:CR=1 FL=1
MSDTIQVTILNRLKVIAGSDFTSGFSGLNLSNKIIIGSSIGASIVPSATLLFVDTVEQQGRTMGRYLGESVYQIVCYAGGTSVETRVQNAMNLAGDIQKAITQDRTLNLAGKTEDVIVNFTALDGEEYGINQCGVALIEIRVTHQSDFGV